MNRKKKIFDFFYLEKVIFHKNKEFFLSFSNKEKGWHHLLLGMTTGGFRTEGSHFDPTCLFFLISKLISFKKLNG